MSKYAAWANPEGALQKRLLTFLEGRSWKGATVHECYHLFETSDTDHPEFASHGWISGALSTLHRDRRITRLSEKRNGAKVYVHPEFLDARPSERQGRSSLTKAETLFFRTLEERLDYWLQPDAANARFGTDRTKAERNQRLFFAEMRSLWMEKP